MIHRACSAALVAALTASCAGPALPVERASMAAAINAAHAVPVVGGCAIFPADNPWNTDVSRYPVDPNSAAYLRSMNASATSLHPDFGSNRTYGIPFVVVPQTQPLVPVKFTYADESDKGPYPIPRDAPIEGGANSTGDRHVLVLQQGACKLYELYDAHYVGPGWRAGSGAVFTLSSNHLRPNCWTSADAAGLPIMPALVKYDEVQAGVINHALRFTASRTQNGFIHPATHQAGSKNAALPPMGLRLRLKASYNISRFHGEAHVILVAMKKYGMLLADNGSNFYFQGATDHRWNDDDLNALKRVPGSAFEAVKTGPIHRGC